jgi:hypothetical protein
LVEGAQLDDAKALAFGGEGKDDLGEGSVGAHVGQLPGVGARVGSLDDEGLEGFDDTGGGGKFDEVVRESGRT